MEGKSTTTSEGSGLGSTDGTYCGCNGAGAAGAGFSTSSVNSNGRSFLAGGAGATDRRSGQCAALVDGSFGGGGNGGNGGGGGGGFKGGFGGGVLNAGGTLYSSLSTDGQGGFSYNAGTSTSGFNGNNAGDGYIIIEPL